MKRTAQPKAQVHELAMARITLSDEVQPRGGEDIELMREYTREMLDGAEFPPVDVFWDREADEYHPRRRVPPGQGGDRRAAAIDPGLSPPRDHAGRDPVQRRGQTPPTGSGGSNEDKRIAVMKLLEDPEWALWNNAEIARGLPRLARDGGELPQHRDERTRASGGGEGRE